jgi:hypothetical protein
MPGPIGVLLTATVVWFAGVPAPALSAQSPCQFVLGFAAFRDMIGRDTVGECIENQRTITALSQDEHVQGSFSFRVSQGNVVQKTTNGLLVWQSSDNSTAFVNGTYAWLLMEPSGLRSGPFPEQASPPAAAPLPTGPAPQASAPPAPRPPDPQLEAQKGCTDMYAALLIGSLFDPPAVQQRKKAESEAISFLCRGAVDQYGPRGLECFQQAWDRSRGMEAVFPGSGRATYDQVLQACIART